MAQRSDREAKARGKLLLGKAQALAQAGNVYRLQLIHTLIPAVLLPLDFAWVMASFKLSTSGLAFKLPRPLKLPAQRRL